ncbi:MAG: TPM domain-containing protein [Epulopiscium sp.]|nr:TPM domain-containing protein [Candidatus Epulonipiscium sp.]
MFRKIGILLFVFSIIITMGNVQVKADITSNVIDFLDYLNQEEIKDLQQSIDDVAKEYELDTVIVITDDTKGKTSQAFADDYYDNNDYGIGSDYSGLLLLVNMGERKMHISTTGKAIDIFTDGRIQDMINNITPLLSEGKYYKAAQAFVSDIRYYAKEGIPIGQYQESVENKSIPYLYRVKRLLTLPVTYAIAVVISLIATIVVSFSSKGKTTINHQTYEGKNSFALSNSGDYYIRQFTTKTRIESSSGNKSSVHSGSSGRSHGGGGGRF